MLEKIMNKRGISIRDEKGALRNLVDVLEDMYLKLNGREVNMMFFEMSEEEREANIFNDERGRAYKGVK